MRLLSTASIARVLAGAFVLTAVLAVTSDVQQADASYPGLNGKIAFLGPHDGMFGRDVYVVEAAGGSPVNLTQNTVYRPLSSPAWSADGEMLAFNVAEFNTFIGNSVGVIFTMRADGSDLTRLSLISPLRGYKTDNRDPSWSADGTQLAYYRGLPKDNQGTPHPPEAFDVFRAGSDGTGGSSVTANPSADDVDPSWSPDGAKIAFVSMRDGNAEIYVINPDGSGETRLTNTPEHERLPDWSPDGSRIAFQRDGEVMVMNADGTGITNLTNHAGADGQPSWSPDGSKMAFASRRDDHPDDAEIYIMNANGSDQTRLTFDGGHSPSWQPVTHGDADCSGGVSSVDAALVLQLDADLISDLPCPDSADVNRDGAIDAADANVMLQFVARLISALPV